MKDLTQSKVDLQAYTLKSIMALIPLVENHLSELVAIGAYLEDPEKFREAWLKTQFCRECITRHGGEISGYALECIRGACDPVSGWRDLHNLGSELYDFFLEKTSIEDYTKDIFTKTQQFLTRLRSVRKKLTEGKSDLQRENTMKSSHVQDDNPIHKHITDTGLGIGGSPRRGKPKTEEERREQHITRYGTEELPFRGSGLDSIDKYAGQPILLINVETGKGIPGGRVVSEEKALATGCHGYDIGEGKRMLWSKGVVGSLSLPEQKKFCHAGMDLKPMTGALKKRITALREAGIEF